MKYKIQEIKLKWKYRILAISMLLMFSGAICPTILPKYGIALIVSVIIGAIVSIGNFAYLCDRIETCYNGNNRETWITFPHFSHLKKFAEA